MKLGEFKKSINDGLPSLSPEEARQYLWRNIVGVNPLTPDETIKETVELLALERERCARIAEKFGEDGASDWREEPKVVARWIAEKIRNGG